MGVLAYIYIYIWCRPYWPTVVVVLRLALYNPMYNRKYNMAYKEISMSSGGWGAQKSEPGPNIKQTTKLTTVF